MEGEEGRQDLRGEEQSCGGGGAWSWGAGSEGQLATGRLDDETVPQFLPSLSSALPISQIACGGAHAIALTGNGTVMTWGRGKSGQLGHGNSENQLEPKVVEVLKDKVIHSVAAGWNHSGFVSDIGCLYTCGDGSYGQLGHGDYKTQSLPLKVLYFNSKHVAQVMFGMRHSLVLLEGKNFWIALVNLFDEIGEGYQIERQGLLESWCIHLALQGTANLVCQSKKDVDPSIFLKLSMDSGRIISP